MRSLIFYLVLCPPMERRCACFTQEPICFWNIFSEPFNNHIQQVLALPPLPSDLPTWSHTSLHTTISTLVESITGSVTIFLRLGFFFFFLLFFFKKSCLTSVYNPSVMTDPPENSLFRPLRPGLDLYRTLLFYGL